ncbi:MAG: hypothetical protein Q9211_005155 [Gyalolechia sp. 1 TL-2023]
MDLPELAQRSSSSFNGFPTKAYVLRGPRDLRVQEGLLPLPGPDELQITIQAISLCRYDLHYFKHYWNEAERPVTLGIESAGTVTHVGSGVTKFEIGDAVAIEVGPPCGECTKCDGARYDLCESVNFRGGDVPAPEYQGAFHERINLLATRCYKLSRFSLELVALLKPLTVAIDALDQAQIRRSQSVLILGAGTIGLLCGAICTARFVNNVVIADIREDRMLFAVEHGYASKGIAVPIFGGQDVRDRLEFAKEVAASATKLCYTVYRRMLVDGFDLVLECSGSELSTQTAIYACRPNGKVLLVSMHNPIRAVPIAAAAHRKVEIMTANSTSTYEKAIDMLTKYNPALPNLRTLITHRFYGWANLSAALDMATRIKDDEEGPVLKVIVKLDDAPGSAVEN